MVNDQNYRGLHTKAQTHSVMERFQLGVHLRTGVTYIVQYGVTECHYITTGIQDAGKDLALQMD